MYGGKVEDKELIERLQALRPKHVVITVGGGTQERLGLYLKRNLDYLPAIHCIGAAIAFLSGDQVRIPEWADRFYPGWLFRCMSSPRRYVPRYFSRVAVGSASLALSRSASRVQRQSARADANRLTAAGEVLDVPRGVD
jgi:UDP-N-acetyl-D-mannosaminuronic acid transferase (WecB/TagA/CpsF family)